jgi:hypothetical protein
LKLIDESAMTDSEWTNRFLSTAEFFLRSQKRASHSIRRERSPIRMSSDETQNENNESALTLIADTPGAFFGSILAGDLRARTTALGSRVGSALVGRPYPIGRGRRSASVASAYR